MRERLTVVWLTYVTRPFVMVFSWILLLLSLSFGGILAGQAARHGAEPAAAHWHLLTLFTVSGFAGMVVGGQLLVQFQTSIARLLPRFAVPHLLIAGGLLCGAWCLGASVLFRSGVSWPVIVLGASVTLGVAVVVLGDAFPGPRGTPVRMALWSLGPGVAILCAAAVISLYPSISELSAALHPGSALVGTMPLVILAVIICWNLPNASRYFAEEGGGSLPMGVAGFDMPLGSASHSRRSVVRGRWRADVGNTELNVYHGQRWLRRLRLWQAGGAPGVLNTLLQFPLMWLSLVIVSRDSSVSPYITMGVFIVFAGVVQYARMRQPRFPQEWLRPVSRQTAVDDFLRGIAVDLLPVPILVICACAWHVLVNDAKLDWELEGRLLSSLPSTYVLGLGIAAVLTLTRTTLHCILGSLLFGFPAASLAVLFAPPETGTLFSTFFVVLGATNLTVGIALIAFARHRWLHRELL